MRLFQERIVHTILDIYMLKIIFRSGFDITTSSPSFQSRQHMLFVKNVRSPRNGLFYYNFLSSIHFH